jgi:hypothetical protein
VQIQLLLRGIAACIALSGCQLYQAATFEPHPLSHLPPSKVKVALYSPTLLTQSGGDRAVGKACYPPPPSTAQKPVLLPVAAAAALTAVASYGLSLAGDELNAYLEKKKKEFTNESAGHVDAQYFLIPSSSSDYNLAFDCIVFTQTTQDPVTKNDVDGFSIYARLVPSEDRTAIRIIPVQYKLSRSAAKTDTSGKVDIDVQFTLSAAMTDAKSGDLTLSKLTDQTVKLQGVVIGQEVSNSVDTQI